MWSGEGIVPRKVNGVELKKSERTKRSSRIFSMNRQVLHTYTPDEQ